MTALTTLAKVKLTHDIRTTAKDDTINDWIAAAKRDLQNSGVNDPDETDELVLSAIKSYCGAQIDIGTPKGEAWQRNYDKLVSKLASSGDYSD